MAGKRGETAGQTSTAKPTSPAKQSRADGSNRRRFDRRDTAIPARLSHDGQRYDGHVTNLSLDGCLFNPAPDLPNDSKVKIWLSGRQADLSGRVVMRSARGLHCSLSVAVPTLARISAELDGMALLLLGATRLAEPAPIVPPAAAKKPPIKRTARKVSKKTAKKAVSKTPLSKRSPAKKKR